MGKNFIEEDGISTNVKPDDIKSQQHEKPGQNT